jgi:hypothetical protein
VCVREREIEREERERGVEVFLFFLPFFLTWSILVFMNTPCSCTGQEAWNGCHEGVRAGVMTMRTSPEDHF